LTTDRVKKMNRYLLETDQNQCYTEDGRSVPCKNSGQDACRQKARRLSGRQRFQVLEQLVRDNLTGAVWTRNANPAEYPLTWIEALAYVADMRQRRAHGCDHWQLPSRGLLFSLVSHQNINPALPDGHPFDNVFPGYFWSADSCSRLPDQAWYVHLGGGRVHRGMKHGSYMVWPMSPGKQSATDPGHKEKARFIADGACIHDAATGLTWSKDANPAGNPLTWQGALSMVDTLNREQFGGRHDWRLPNIMELESLVDLGAHSPALRTDHPFANVQDAYWSSTTSVYEPRYAWTLYSRDGIIGVGFKPGDDFFLWPVRTG
jgi:hypothetical protein